MAHRAGSLDRETILALLFAVTVESVLAQVFDLTRYDSLAALVQALQGALASDLPRIRLITLQVFVFLFTLVRFYLGAYRYGQETTGRTRTAAWFDDLSTMLLFLGLYVTSRTVKTTSLFYLAVAGFHVLDFVWFFITTTFSVTPRPVSRVIRAWQFFDFVTFSAIGVAFWVGFHPQSISLLVLLVVGVWDFRWFRHFYAHRPDWENQTWLVKRVLGAAS